MIDMGGRCLERADNRLEDSAGAPSSHIIFIIQETFEKPPYFSYKLLELLNTRLLPTIFYFYKKHQ